MRRLAALGLSLTLCSFACKSEDPPADAATSSTPAATPEPELPKPPAPEPVEPPDSEQPKPPEPEPEQPAEPTTELLVARDIEVVDVDIEWVEIADVRKKAPNLVTMERGIVGASADKLYTLDDQGKFVAVADNLTRHEFGAGLKGRWPSDAWLIERDPDKSGMFRPYRLVDGARWEPIAVLAASADGGDWLYDLLWTLIRSQRGGMLVYERAKTDKLKRIGAPGGDVALPEKRRNKVLGYLELPSGELQLVTAEPLEDIHYIEMGARDLRLPEPDDHTWRIYSVGLTSTQSFVLAGIGTSRYLMQYEDNTWSLWTFPSQILELRAGSIHVADDEGIWVLKPNGWQEHSQRRKFVYHRSPAGSWQRVWSPVEGEFDFAISDDGLELWCVAHDDRGYRLLEASALSPEPRG